MPIKAQLNKKDEAFLQMSLNAPMWRVVLHVGTPLALYQALAMVFTVLDTMMASHISKESVSAVAYLSQIQLLLSSVGGGLAVGAGIQISRAYGEEDFLMVRRRVSSLYAISLSLGLLMLLVILPFRTSFLRLAGTPEELIAVGSRYFAVQLFVMVVNFLNGVYIAVERARGNANRIFALNLVVIVVKLSLTAVFVYVLHSDLTMIAVASLLSELAMFAFAVRYSLAGDSAFSFSFQAISFDRIVTLPMLRQSWPVVAEKALFAFGKTIVNAMSALYGPLMVGRYRRVLQAFYATALINMLLGAVISSIELWQLRFLSGLFDGGSEAFRAMIALVYRYEALGAVPLGLNAAVLALLYGLGKTKLTLLLNFCRVFVFRIPVFWFLQHCTQFGQKSAGIVMMVSNTASGLMALIVALFVIHAFKKSHALN